MNIQTFQSNYYNKELDKKNKQIQELTNKVNKLLDEKMLLNKTIHDLTEQNHQLIILNEHENKKLNLKEDNKLNELYHVLNDLKKENEILKNKLNESIEIKEDYLFIGSIFKNDKEIHRKKIMIFFGKFPNKIELTFENGSFDIPIQKIPLITKVKDREGYIIIRIYSDDDKEKKIICQFNQRECDYILKFYYNMKKNYEENKEQVRLMSYNIDNFSF